MATNANSFSNFTLLLTLIFNTYVLGQLPKISHQTIYFNKEKQKRTAENQTTTDVTILWISSVPFQGRRRHTPVKVYWSDSLPSMGFWTSTLGGCCLMTFLNIFMFMGWWWYLKKCSVTISMVARSMKCLLKYWSLYWQVDAWNMGQDENCWTCCWRNLYENIRFFVTSVLNCSLTVHFPVFFHTFNLMFTNTLFSGFRQQHLRKHDCMQQALIKSSGQSDSLASCIICTESVEPPCTF